MNIKTKHGPSCFLLSAMFGLGLISAAISKQWWLFWGIIAANAVAGIIGVMGYFLTSRTRRTIHRNMTPHEKAALSGIGQQAGKKLGIRVAPIAVIAPFLGIIFGLKGLIYIIPTTIILLIILCAPVWRAARRQTNDMLLSTVFAQINGIETLR